MDDFFQNYFALKIILLNILQNIAIYLFKYFALNTMMFWNDAFPYKKKNQITLCCMILRKVFLKPELIK